MKYTIVSILLISFISLAGSLPFSRSGVIDCPDAYVLQHTEIEAALSVATYSVQDSAGAGNSELMITGYLDVGLFRYAQIGISYLGDGGVVGNIKFAVLQEGISVPAFAIGLENMTGEEGIDCFKIDSAGVEIFYNYDHAQNWSAYGVASKNLNFLLGIPATVNLGIGIGRFVGVVDSGALGIGSSIAHGLFGSVVYYPNDLFTIAFEQDGRDLNLGVSYEISSFITLEMAWAELEQTIFPAKGQNKTDVMQNSKTSFGVRTRIGPVFGPDRIALEREQQRIERARNRLQELEARRRAAESELQRLRDLLENR
ncbi:MAG: hypothetical protein KAQ97_07755 [Candidatus Fermentibacteraceae bacterium]|nr:hypothetical protein [Candidatus Fermentibacteraceae bacterium]